jgi:tetratricopeptide (TPR) repeat protein
MNTMIEHPAVRWRRWSRAGLGLGLCFGLFVASWGCSTASHQDRRAELQQMLDQGRYDDALAQVKVYREAGEAGPALDFAQGVALLHQNADNIALPLLRQAVAEDSTYTLPASKELETLARADEKAGWLKRGGRRMHDAYLMNPAVDLSGLRDRVGDLFYRFDEDYEHAVDIYHTLYEERNGPVQKQKEWVFRYANCVELTGSPEAALSIYEEFYKTWPDDTTMLAQVAWKYMKILMGLAQDAAARGEDDLAMRQYIRALDWGYHPTLKQQIHIEMAKIERNRGNLDEARRQYKLVLHFAGDVSGTEYTDQAKQGLEELAAMGVH